MNPTLVTITFSNMIEQSQFVYHIELNIHTNRFIVSMS